MDEERRTAPNSFNNPRFREELGELLDEKLAPLFVMQKVVVDHDRQLSEFRGQQRLLKGLWLVLVAIVGGIVKFVAWK